MNGLELSRGYFEEYGKPMLENDFPELLSYIAVGFAGSGSEHYGFDDEVSRDHDYEPGFCIFIPGEDVIDRKTAFQLERAYAKLPKEYGGVKRQLVSPVGGNRNGVIRTDEFYQRAVGSPDGRLSVSEWLHIPDYALAEAVNGEIFLDGYGEVSEIRRRIADMPEDIRRKRIAGNLLIMAQAGQYNFMRCINHGEPDAAQLACVRFTEAAMRTVFLLKRKYMPYYKWSFRALRQLGGTGELTEKLAFLLSGDNRDESYTEVKYMTIEEIAGSVIEALNAEGLTKAICGDLEKHAYSVNDGIGDGTVRNMNIFTCVNE